MVCVSIVIAWLGFKLKGGGSSPGTQGEDSEQQKGVGHQKGRKEGPTRTDPKSSSRERATHHQVPPERIRISPDVPPYGTFWSFSGLSLRIIAFCGQKNTPC